MFSRSSFSTNKCSRTNRLYLRTSQLGWSSLDIEPRTYPLAVGCWTLARAWLEWEQSNKKALVYRARLNHQDLMALGGLDNVTASVGAVGFVLLEMGWEAVSVFHFLAGSSWLVCLVHCWAWICTNPSKNKIRIDNTTAKAKDTDSQSRVKSKLSWRALFWICLTFCSCSSGAEKQLKLFWVLLKRRSIGQSWWSRCSVTPWGPRRAGLKILW